MPRLKVIGFLLGFTALLGSAHADLPSILNSNPRSGDTSVDPSLTTATVTFDRLMTPSGFLTGRRPLLPVPEGATLVWRDRRTVEIPIKLEPGKMYAIGVNGPEYRVLKTSAGMPFPPRVITFCTKGAGEEVIAQMQPPKVTKFDPPNAARAVDPSVTTASVTFDRKMDVGFALLETGPSFPDGLSRPIWSEDHLTCSFPMRLLPGESYQLGLNDPENMAFISETGVPLEPVTYKFRTLVPAGGKTGP